jgi:hypothetical protein
MNIIRRKLLTIIEDKTTLRVLISEGLEYIVGLLIKKLLYQSLCFIMVVEKLPTIKWDPIVDDKPNTTSPRIKFSQEFARENQRESNGNILDLGCGTGSYTYIVDREGCVGIDLHIMH